MKKLCNFVPAPVFISSKMARGLCPRCKEPFEKHHNITVVLTGEDVARKMRAGA